MALRWQRNRHQFVLAQAALDKGVAPPWPEGPPFWLASLRQGLVTVALGIGLMLAGGAAWGFSHGLEPPAIAQVSEPSPPPLANLEPKLAPEPRHQPPPPNPALEEWHRMQAVSSLGLLSTAAGFVLALVGIVRALFARVERRYSEIAKH
jgi:hypothetical protein